jgi:hypothetical protein
MVPDTLDTDTDAAEVESWRSARSRGLALVERTPPLATLPESQGDEARGVGLMRGDDVGEVSSVDDAEASESRSEPCALWILAMKAWLISADAEAACKAPTLCPRPRCDLPLLVLLRRCSEAEALVQLAPSTLRGEVKYVSRPTAESEQLPSPEPVRPNEDGRALLCRGLLLCKSAGTAWAEGERETAAGAAGASRSVNTCLGWRCVCEATLDCLPPPTAPAASLFVR